MTEQGFKIKERICQDCGKKSNMLIYWKGKDRCEKCDREFDPTYFIELKGKANLK